MSLALALGIGLAGGLGAVARRLLDAAVTEQTRSAFPWGTLAVNLSGTFTLGVLAGAGIGHDASRLLATGLLGAYTTFSTWMVDSAGLGRPAAAANLLGSLVLGLAAIWLGRRIGTGLG